MNVGGEDICRSFGILRSLQISGPPNGRGQIDSQEEPIGGLHGCAVIACAK